MIAEVFTKGDMNKPQIEKCDDFKDLVFYDWYMKGAFQMLLRLNEEAFLLNAEKMSSFELKKLFDLLLKDRLTRDKFMSHDYDCIGIRNRKYKIDKKGNRKLVDFDYYLTKQSWIMAEA